MCHPNDLYTLYTRLRDHFGDLYGEACAAPWWPIFGDDPPFEMLLAAILVQQTRWEKVEQTILRLRDAGLLSPSALAQTGASTLVSLLRSVSFYTQKSAGITAISSYLCTHYGGSMAAMLNQPTDLLRSELLSLPRIGPETADVVLLYAGRHAVFVVDDYTRRLFDRVRPSLKITPSLPKQGEQRRQQEVPWKRSRYAVVRSCIESNLLHTLQQQRTTSPHSLQLSTQHVYANYHALINEQCVRYCLTRKPRCDGPPARRIYSIQQGRDSYLERSEGCPLREMCAFYQEHYHSGV